MKTERPSQINPLRERLRPYIGSGKHIAVIAQPKSGSTALCNILAEITGWPVDSYADRSVYDLSFSTLKASRIGDSDRIIHLHSLPTPALVAWLIERQMVPLILYRDIPSGVVSMYHHHLRTDASLSDRVRQLTYERGIEETAWMWAHWFARFQREWRSTLRHLPGLSADHSELFSDPVSLVGKVLARNGVAVEAAAVAAAADAILADPERSNFHNSRGVLPDYILGAIERLAS